MQADAGLVCVHSQEKYCHKTSMAVVPHLELFVYFVQIYKRITEVGFVGFSDVKMNPQGRN